MKRFYNFIIKIWIKLNRAAEQSQTLQVDAKVQSRAPANTHQFPWF
jgi:hypothetical protein